MSDIAAERYQSQIERIKTNVRRAYDYFKPNYDRYNEFNRFVFESSLKEEEITLLMTLSKPQLEFNILEAYISRLLGEFSKQEPDIAISADDENTADPLTIKVLEQHLRHTLCDSSNSHTKYEVYKDILGGGFSTLRVSTEYAHPMSFDQVIKIERVYDPTLVGFDQLARMSHKGDGRFCFELFPMSKDDFMEEYPDIPIERLNFRRDFAGFNWSYLNNNTPSLIIADYYEKKKKEVTIVKVRTGEVMTKKKYDEMLKNWGNLEAPPALIGKPRKTMLESIERYRLIENMILLHEDTDFTHLPLIFVDGNSRMIKTPKNGNVRQVTRPYVYHAKGAQRLKNYAGIALANEIENIVQHKFIIKKEALPKEQDLLAAIKDIQKPSNIIVNAFYEKNPNQPIPEPIREIIRVPAPPETLQAFTGSDSLIQNILGSYDASLGINNNQLSGIAIVEAASQSNATAMPYIVGYLQGYQRAAQIYVDLLPKYYTTPRTIPLMDNDGKKGSIGALFSKENKGYVEVDPEKTVNMFYDANALNVVVKAGASFQVQKSRTIMMVKEMMGMSPLFAEFISEKGLPFVLDNMEGKGIEQLKEMVEGWLQELQQRKQAAMQQQQAEAENNPAKILEQKNQIAMAKLQQDAQKDEKQFQLDIIKIQAEQKRAEMNMDRDREKNAVQIVKAQTERLVHRDKHQMGAYDQRHRHLKEALEIHIKHKDMDHRHNQKSEQKRAE
jgi:hypothetical protein